MEDTKVQWHPGFVAAMNLDIVEYKSPEDHLDIDVFYKTMAYAALYKSYGKTLDAIRADDVTVTLIREAKPKGLIRYLKEHNYKLITSIREFTMSWEMFCFRFRLLLQENWIWRSISG